MQYTYADLGTAVSGEVVTPDAPAYDLARRPAMVRFHDIEPQAVVRCRNAADVAETLAFAGRAGIPVAVRSGGHCLAGRSSTTGIVIDVSPMNSVSVADGAVTVGAGTRLADLYDALDAHGLTLPAGCGPTVGIAGLTLGGGLGVLGRQYGLTCDRLVAAEVVLADGRTVECDEHRDADLFWALRGAGGGQFGVATAFVFEPVPAQAATMFHHIWPSEVAAAAIEAWQDWAPDQPGEVNASLKVTAADAVHLFGVVLGPEADGVQRLVEFAARVGADPERSSHEHMPYRTAKAALVGVGSDEEADPGPMFSKSEFFRRPLPRDAISVLLALLGEGGELNFTPMGGAYNRVPPDATAFVHREERYIVEHVAPDAGRQWLQRSWATIHPWGSGRVYPNFPDPELENWAEAYWGDNHERLRRVKRAYDPDGVFRFEQSL